MSEHFNECCDNCKWSDHAAHCSVHKNDENDDSIDESECVARLRQIALTSSLTETVFIDLKV